MNLCAADAKTVTFKVKDYRIDGPGRYKTMTLDDQPAVRDRHARRKRAVSNTIDPMVPVIARAKPGEQAAATRQIPSRPRPNHAKRNGRGRVGSTSTHRPRRGSSAASHGDMARSCTISCATALSVLETFRQQGGVLKSG